MTATSTMGKSSIIRGQEIKTTRVKIVGDSPLITRRYVDRRKDVPVDVHIKKITPVEEFISGIYWITNETKFPGSTQSAAEAQKAETMEDFLLACSKGARFGIPAVVIKNAAVDAAAKAGMVPAKVYARSLFFIRDEGLSDGLVEIKAAPPRMREDLIRIPGSTRIESRFRAEFYPWSCEFDLQYNAANPVALEDILLMIDTAGFDFGIGEWRKERGGKYGTFHVEK